MKLRLFFTFLCVGLVAILIGGKTVLAYTSIAVYGQLDYTTGVPNRGGEASADSFNYPLSIVIDSSGGFYVVDRNNHRVLYFANDGDTTADRVYGQHGDLTAHIANN